jgi:hypothetical protein
MYLPSAFYSLRFIKQTIKNPKNVVTVLLLNYGLLYTLYNHTFDKDAFVFSYLYCGIGQGFINAFLHAMLDYIQGNHLDTSEWKQDKYIKYVDYSKGAAYMVAIPGLVYNSLTIMPRLWSFDFPGWSAVLFQGTYSILFFDLIFYMVHYTIHKIPKFRIPHLKIHHGCDVKKYAGHCTIAGEPLESLIRDLLTVYIPTHCIPGGIFYAWLWVPYYSMYSWWALYVHSGRNNYHTLHHTKHPDQNFGLFYLWDYLFRTLTL